MGFKLGNFSRLATPLAIKTADGFEIAAAPHKEEGRPRSSHSFFPNGVKQANCKPHAHTLLCHQTHGPLGNRQNIRTGKDENLARHRWDGRVSLRGEGGNEFELAGPHADEGIEP